jgi:uncharacterized protein with ParB-like and HNH nuclease domain
MNPLFEEIEKIISSKFSDEKKTDQIRFVLGGHKKLTFKTISDLLSQNFSVPSYQRGYKWKVQQVSDLLNDIWEFSKTDPAEDQFYCLQPIIVKREMNKATHQWSIIDGQQRLTTIYLILKYLGTTSFSLDYNTRDDSGIYLTSTDRSSVKDNIDVFHFKLAEKTITAWFEGKSDEDKTLWEKTLLTKTRIIWYNPDSSDAKSEIDVFTRINSGKIPLTNSELIRALFIHHSKRSENDEVTLLLQHKIASEWDYIEQQLHDEDFWCFVTLGQPFQKKTYPNRIEYFLDLVEARHKGSRTDDTYSTFRMYSLWISQEKRRSAICGRSSKISTTGFMNGILTAIFII